MAQRHRYHGFTLIEMVITLVLIGIVAGILAPMIKNSVDAYTATQSRSHLHDKVRVAIGRLSREISLASKYLLSTPDSSTIIFTTTSNGGRYIADINDPGDTECQPFIPGVSLTYLCVIGNFSGLSGPVVIDSGTPVATASIAPHTTKSGISVINFGSPATFNGTGQQQFALADYKHRVSLSGTNLVWERVAPAAASFTSAVTGLLLDNVTSFTVTPLDGSGVVSLSITTTDGNETISVDEDIYVRN